MFWSLWLSWKEERHPRPSCLGAVHWCFEIISQGIPSSSHPSSSATNNLLSLLLHLYWNDKVHRKQQHQLQDCIYFLSKHIHRIIPFSGGVSPIPLLFVGSLLQLAPSKIFKLYLLVTMNEVNDRGGDQGQTGRVFQLRVGSGRVLGICIKYQVILVLWGNDILIVYSPSISLIYYTL